MRDRARLLFSPLVAVLLCLSCMASGCALLGKAKPLDVRYFNLDADPGDPPQAQAASLRLRLGSVSAARHIERRFVSRLSPHELTYYDAWRWTDEPDAFLERILHRDLFERAGITRVVSGAAPTLEVELIAFEELQQKKRAQVAVLAVMLDDRVQLWQRTFQVDAEIGGGEPATALASALSKALAKVAGEITAQTLATLTTPPPSAAAAEPAAQLPPPPRQ